MSRSDKRGQNGSAESKPPVKEVDVPWGGYVDIRMDDDDIAQFRVWSTAEAESFWLEFVELLGAGFKFGLSFNVEGDFYLATFTAHGDRLIGLDLRYCLTARAPSWEEAVMLLLFKHLVMARGSWGNFKPKTRKMERFG
jgi:hypothetical protein